MNPTSTKPILIRGVAVIVHPHGAQIQAPEKQATRIMKYLVDEGFLKIHGQQEPGPDDLPSY